VHEWYVEQVRAAEEIGETARAKLKTKEDAEGYRTNEARADDKYTSRRVTCEGFMHKLEKTDSGDYAMSFEYFVDGFNMAKGIVYAYFPASEADRLRKFEFRSPVYFTGRCDGWDRRMFPAIVAIRDCRVAPAPKSEVKPKLVGSKPNPKEEPPKREPPQDR
jgi:hypothetical protein